MALADLMRPQGSSAAVTPAVPLLAQAVVLSRVPAGLMVELDDQPGVAYGPLTWSPPYSHSHTVSAGGSTSAGPVSVEPAGRRCLVAFPGGDPGLGWVLQVAW